MSVNLMDTLKEAVSEEIMGKIGGLIGQSGSGETKSLVDTAAGSILGGLMKKASTPGGANDVFQAVEDHDDGVLDRLGDLLDGDDSRVELESSGGRMLDTVFGGQTQGMAGALAEFLGLDEAMVKKLLAMVAPMVMGIIKRQMKSRSLDSVGLGNLLGEQKDSLANLLPTSLSNSLGFGDMLDSSSNVVGDVVETARDDRKAVAKSSDETTESGGTFLKFVLPLVLLAALVFFGYKAFNPDPVSSRPPSSGGKSFGESAGSVTKAFELSALSDQLGDITTAFEGVNADNAGALAEKISNLTKSFGEMGIDKLDGAAKESATTAIGKFKDAVTNSMQAITDEGILGTLKPVIEKLLETIVPLLK